jgi:chromosome partitioning protein
MSFPDEAATAPSEADGSPPYPSPEPTPSPAPIADPMPAVADPRDRVEGVASVDPVAVAAHEVSTASGDTLPPRVSAQRPLPRIMAVANQKGGVGKTTTTINVGACLAELGQRTLIIDLDPQGNASTGLGIENRGLETSMYHVLMHEVPLENCIEPTDVKGLFVAPASLDLAGAEIELVPAFSRETRLKRAIDAVLDDYDYVLIDCPPSLGLLTVNGLSAAREVLVPIQCEYYALEGLGQLLRNVDLVRRNLNPELDVSTIVCVMYDARTKLADQVVSEVRDHFGEKVLRTIVPRSVRLSEAPSFGQPIITFDPRSRGAFAYRDVAKEVHDDSAQRVG